MTGTSTDFRRSLARARDPRAACCSHRPASGNRYACNLERRREDQILRHKLALTVVHLLDSLPLSMRLTTATSCMWAGTMSCGLNSPS